jgi:hypothetical protein
MLGVFDRLKEAGFPSIIRDAVENPEQLSMNLEET